jgi:hypothetical protein
MYQKSSPCFQLKYPCIRDELLRVLQQIVDAEAQRQDWVRQNALPRSDTNRLSALLQFVYISASLATEPHFTIGLFLKNVDEMRSVWAVFDAVEQVFQTVGIDATCEIYLTCSEWSKLVQANDRALQICRRSANFLS